MNVVLPTWFKGRQGKSESVGDNLLKLTGPNLVEGVIGIRSEANGWLGFVRSTQDGPDLDQSRTPVAQPNEAWAAAFELFRNHNIA